ncbi:hypothetical protein GCM10022419_133290 [Nonomuraea rosea]|uniref:histidine kinase n=1 Tax=Nonomuraea rosea TaxID=638574 RepID=A0ABP7A515_9ACTN
MSLAHRDAANWREVAERLLADHRRLDRLTSDLLMLARLDEGTATRVATPVRLDEIVAAEIPEITHAVVTAHLEQIEVVGVVPELSRLVRNLLDNADRHAATTIDVRLARDGATAVLTIDDDGAGIPADQRDRVFDRFYRVDGGRDRSSGGVGLGLAMVRGIARRHRGDVTISTAPAGGARFEVRLPADSAWVQVG